MSKSRVQKTAALERLTQAFKSGKSAVFSDYQGMTVSKISALRKQLVTSQVDFVVAKKTLLKLAAKSAGYEVDFKSMPGMLGAAFAQEDEMAPAKLIGDAGKTAPIKLVGGIFEGKVVDQAYVIALSQLPSKSQLFGQLLSVFNGPASAFVRLLAAYKDKKNEGAPVVSAPVAEVPAEAPVEASAPAETAAPEAVPEVAPEATSEAPAAV